MINANVGKIPYTSYNTSIIKLSSDEFKSICKGENNIDYKGDVLAFLFFVRPPGHRWGSMNWVGFASHSNVLNLFDDSITDINDNFWLIQPMLLQNVLGPKLADPRLFKIKKNNLISMALVGYTRVAPKSNTQYIADYYVRASLVNSMVKSISDNTKEWSNSYNFGKRSEERRVGKEC